MNDAQLEQFLELWKFVAWCDQKRWESESEWEVNLKRESIKEMLGFIPTDSELVLAHWLTYIFDYMIRVEQVWNECFPIMIKVAHDFESEGKDTDMIKKETQKDGRLEIQGTPFSFKHRFPKKTNQRVWRTLRLLDKMDVERNFVKFMLSQTKGEEWIRRVACSLYVLTYSDERENQALERLKTNLFPLLQSKELLWYPKRLWAALRDYLKGPLREEVIEPTLDRLKSRYPEAIGLWEKSTAYLDQLELPGDQWNLQFFGRIELLKKLGEQEKCKNNPRKLLRKIYEEHREKLKGYYPEQFDVTFNFRCNAWACFVCPLKKESSWEDYCLKIGKEVPQRLKGVGICPVLYLLLDYTVRCEPDNCYLFRLKPKLSLCEGIRA